MNQKSLTSWKSNRVLVVVALTLAVATSASAQQVDLNQFRPTERAHDGFTISTASDQGKMTVGFQAYMDYSNDPLSLTNGSGGETQVVHQQMTGHVVVSIGLWNRLVLYGGIPVHFLIKEDKGDNFAGTGASAPDGGGFGDHWIGARVRVLGTEKDLFQLALQGTVNIGAASIWDSEQNYRGVLNDKPRAGMHPEILGTFNWKEGRYRLSLNTGYNVRKNTNIGPIPIVDEWTYGVGAIIGLLQGKHSVDGIVELLGRTNLPNAGKIDGLGKKVASPLEALLGAKYHHENGFTAGMGMGVGVLRQAYGVPDFRMFAMLGYTMRDKTEMDSDKDGVSDESDRCIDQAEDKDGYRDTDGCPDDDNDSDTINDAADKCPMQAEDVDGFSDDDGCPDYDNDGDNINDDQDQCPDEAGSKENYGCAVGRY